MIGMVNVTECSSSANLKDERTVEKAEQGVVQAPIYSRFFQDPILVIKDIFAVLIFHHNPERFNEAMKLVIPFEIRRDSEVELQEAASHRLHMRRELHPVRLRETGLERG